MKEQGEFTAVWLSLNLVTSCSLPKKSRMSSVRARRVVIFTCPIKEPRIKHAERRLRDRSLSQDSTVRVFQLSRAGL